jgi:hypothetical protein
MSNPCNRPLQRLVTRRMAGGDEMAWRTFYNAYFDRLWRYLLVVAAMFPSSTASPITRTLNWMAQVADKRTSN